MVELRRRAGSLMYVDPQGISTGYDDVFTRTDKTRAHYASVGLGNAMWSSSFGEHTAQETEKIAR
jgi:hypothetical protein